jgi:hypothetical protein
MTELRTIGAVARRQHGLVTFDQILAAGVSRSQLRRLVKTGGLIPLRRGVYRHNGVPVTWLQSVLAAVLAGGGRAAASHATAAAIWDLRVGRLDDSELHITSPKQARLVGVRSHVVALPRRELRTHQDIRVTSAERTLLDLASVVCVDELGKGVDDALRRGLLRLDRLRTLVEGSPGRGRRAIIPMRLVLADRLGAYDSGGSDWERDMDRLWDRLGLPPAARQYRVTANGHRYVLDRAIPGLKIGIEWNGFATHGVRSAFDSDSDRRADLTAAGWHMVDFTSHSRPERMVAAVLGAVRSRTIAGEAGALGPP